MGLKLSPSVEKRIESLMDEIGVDSADELVSWALLALEEKNRAFWERIERLDAEADDDVRNGRVRPVTDEFVAEFRAIVTRPAP